MSLVQSPVVVPAKGWEYPRTSMGSISRIKVADHGFQSFGFLACPSGNGRPANIYNKHIVASSESAAGSGRLRGCGR
jgi:hypothetical protein